MERWESNVSHFGDFGRKYFVLNNNKNNIGKFDAKSDKGIFFGYSTHSKAYRVFNKRTLLVEKLVHITFNEHNSLSRNPICDDVDEVEQNLKKLDIHASLNEDQQKWKKYKKHHQANKMLIKVYLRSENSCIIILPNKS